MAQPTPNAVDRIRKVVKKVEAEPYDLTGSARGRDARRQGFWAAVSGAGPRYDWSMMLPDSQGGFAEADPRITGTAAVEINAVTNVPDSTVVRLAFIGFDGTGEPLYAFAYNVDNTASWPIPLHDHRDNLNGGFAFGCYGPGTGLPQNPSTI